MSFEPLELCDHHFARRDQCVTVLVGKGARPERLGEARIGKSFLVRIAGSSDDHAVDHLAGVLDAIGCDASDARCPEGSRRSLPIEPGRRLWQRQSPATGAGRSQWLELDAWGNSNPIRPPTRITPGPPSRFSNNPAPNADFLFLSVSFLGHLGAAGASSSVTVMPSRD